MMLGDFHPYSKKMQLGQKEKETTKIHNPKRYPAKKKKKKNPLKPEVVKGRKIPTKKTRGRITTKEYNETIRQHGFECWVCGTEANLECHHVVPKGFSKIRNGRGQWRNLRFLCSDHHRGKTGVHEDKELMEKLQLEHEKLYGPRYYQDRFDLFKEGLIPNTTIDAYQKFMESWDGEKYG